MSGSQHNPNGRQSQLGSGWSPLQLQMANLLARAPQAHMSSERGVTWHTPTPPPHLYHVPAPSPPDPLQAMKSASGNSVFRHTATPPELYRHTPTPPDKHMIRHTPSPGDVKVAATMPPVDLYPHLGPTRDKLVTAEELLAYRRVGVDLSLGSRANGASPHLPPSPALSVRDAPTINSLIGRVAPRRVDSLLERLAPAPASPHSVIVHSRLAPTPSPPSSEDSADSCGAPPGSKRKRKPERVVRGPPPPDPPRHENGTRDPPAPPHPLDTTRRKTRSGSAETIADIAAMIAEGGEAEPPTLSPVPAPTADKLAPAPDAAPAPAPPPAPAPSPPHPPQALAPTPYEAPAAPAPSPPPAPAPTIAPTPVIPAETEAEKDKDRSQVVSGVETAAAPRRRSARTSNSEATNVPVESPSEGKPAETESAAPASAQPAAASFVEVENQLEKMFAGLEEEPRADSAAAPAPRTHPHKRRRSAPARGRRHARRARAPAPPAPSAPPAPAAPPRPRGPYIQVRGPASSPASVCVMNAATGEEEEAGRRRGEERRRGLHASTLGLRYDAATRDHTWVCAFCGHQPHHAALGDLFGPYAGDDGAELWLHADCGVWASGVVASGARVWGLARAAAGARRARCRECARAPAALACGARACASTAHLHCARATGWLLLEDDFRALCPLHAPAPAPAPLAAP